MTAPATRAGARTAQRWTALAVALTTFALAAPGASAGRVTEIGPGEHLCRAVNALEPGDELVLRPGDYAGPCAIRTGGRPGAPVIIRAKDLRQRPRIHYAGRKANVLEVRASHVVIRGMEIGPTEADVDGVRIYGGEDVTIEDCRFTRLLGIAVVANHGSVRGLAVRRVAVESTGATAVYLGCHQAECAVTDFVLERNYIHGVWADDGSVGYGIQIKLDSVGAIRDNVVVDTKGPGIMVYGARDPSRVSVVERNLVAGSLNSSGIVVGGGPVVVRNNLSFQNRDAGIRLEDYGRRGLLRSVFVLNNTVDANRTAGIAVPWLSALVEVVLANNAVGSEAMLDAPPWSRRGLNLWNNVECGRARCFTAAAAMDYSPGPDLVGRAANHPALRAWGPVDDYFGEVRGTRPSVGAIQRASPVVRFGIKP